MTVRIGKMTFSEWTSLPIGNRYTDTFIFRIDAQACLPPFVYAPLLRRIVAHVRQKRSCASLWVQVDSPGDWFMIEVRKSLRGLKMPYAVTFAGEQVDYRDFSVPPALLHSALPYPPIVENKSLSVTREQLRCLQALGRMKKGNEDEIASLAGLSFECMKAALTILEQKGLVQHKPSAKVRRGEFRPAQLELFSSWFLTSEGLSTALRSWGVPKGTQFTARLEKHLSQIGNAHRQKARTWPAWLKFAWPEAEIWTGWSEVRIPSLSVIPDGLAWGTIHGYETLFWLEVGDGHKSREEITEITTKRLNQAWELCERTGVRLVYAQLSTHWVHEAARWAMANLPKDVAVVMGAQRKFGILPVLEWGKMTGN